MEIIKLFPTKRGIRNRSSEYIIDHNRRLVQLRTHDLIRRIDLFIYPEIRNPRRLPITVKVNLSPIPVIFIQPPEYIPPCRHIVHTDNNTVRLFKDRRMPLPKFIMEDQSIRLLRLFSQRKSLIQMHVHGKKFSGVSKNMIGNMLFHRNYISQYRPFKNTPPIISKSNDHDPIFMPAQRLRTPVLPGATIIAMEEINISRQMILPVCRPCIDIHRQPVQIDRPAVHADIIFFHKENLTSCADILLTCHDPGRRCADKQTRIIREFHLLISFLSIDDHSFRIFLIDIHRQCIRFRAVIRKIIPVLLPLKTKHNKRKPFTCDKR